MNCKWSGLFFFFFVLGGGLVQGFSSPNEDPITILLRFLIEKSIMKGKQLDYIIGLNEKN